MGLTIKKLKTDPKTWIREYIQPVAVQRYRQGIENWRLAIQSAETATNPQRYRMQEIFLDTVLNAHVRACIEKRFSNMMKKGICIVDDKGNKHDDLTKLYNKRWLFQTIRYMWDAKMYGYSLIQLGDMKDFDFDEVYPIRRSNINPDLEIVTSSFYQLEGISVFDEKYTDSLIWIKTPQEIGMAHDWGRCGYGLLYTIAPYEIWFKQAVSLWAEFQQLFGVPIRIGKTDSRDEQMREQMAEMLANMGAKAWGVFDTNDSIELINPMSVPGGNDVFENMITKMEKLIAKVILGHADAIDSIPGKLGASQQDSPADKAMKDIAAFDSQDIEAEIEKSLMPKLVNMGFPMPKGYKIAFNNSDEKDDQRKQEDANNKTTVDIVKTLSDSGYEVDAQYIMDRTAIPVKKKEVVDPMPQQKNYVELKNKLDLYYGQGCEHTH